MSKSNVKEFIMVEITEEEQREATGYVCHERVMFYLFSKIYNLKYFSLFYLDRFWGWKYGQHQEPLIPIYNGLEYFLQENIYENVNVPRKQIYSSLYSFLDKGYKIVMPLWIRHFSDGSLYITPVVIEGIDSEKNVYYTKHTAVDRCCCRKLQKDDFMSMLVVDENEMISYALINECKDLKLLSELSFIESYKYIFTNMYKYEYENGEIKKNGVTLKFDIGAFDTFINSMQQETEKILTSDGIPKEQQFRLYVHINNKIRPMQHMIEYALANQELQTYLDSEFQQELKEQYDSINGAINEVLKYASLLFQKQNQKALDLYVSAITKLKNKMGAYQNCNLKLAKTILDI